MERHELAELHYITAIGNIASILKCGILSHALAEQVEHVSIAMEEIQDKRAGKIVPGGRPLHQYVNLYVCGRNPMMSKRLAVRDQLCVLSVSPTVLDLPSVVISDQNASSKYARFAPAPAGLAIVNRTLTFAEDWTDTDQIVYWRKKSAKCAEVLVPDRVDLSYLRGAYVVRDEVAEAIKSIAPSLATTVDPHLFFA